MIFDVIFLYTSPMLDWYIYYGRCAVPFCHLFRPYFFLCLGWVVLPLWPFLSIFTNILLGKNGSLTRPVTGTG